MHLQDFHSSNMLKSALTRLARVRQAWTRRPAKLAHVFLAILIGAVFLSMAVSTGLFLLVHLFAGMEAPLHVSLGWVVFANLLALALVIAMLMPALDKF
ncbi:MAG TPA: hypothetical protein VF478_02845, partial [Anaerolineae bacterium]